MKDEGAVIAIDATGMKVTRSDDWIWKTLKVRRGRITHSAANVNTEEVLNIEVTDGR